MATVASHTLSCKQSNENSPEDPAGVYVVFLKRQAGETHLQKISEFDS